VRDAERAARQDQVAARALRVLTWGPRGRERVVPAASRCGRALRRRRRRRLAAIDDGDGNDTREECECGE